MKVERNRELGSYVKGYWTKFILSSHKGQWRPPAASIPEYQAMDHFLSCQPTRRTNSNNDNATPTQTALKPVCIPKIRLKKMVRRRDLVRKPTGNICKQTCRCAVWGWTTTAGGYSKDCIASHETQEGP